MGIFINDPFIFSQAFNISNADGQAYIDSESPIYFDKLPTDAEQIENLNFDRQIKNELLFSTDQFFGFKNLQVVLSK